MHIPASAAEASARSTRNTRLDRTLQLLIEGYSFVPRLRRGHDAATARILGQRALCIEGPDAAALLYDDTVFERAGALPEPVRGTLTGKGAVHTLDGADHRHRKGLFLSILSPDGVAQIVRRAEHEWDADPAWSGRGAVSVFDTAAEILMRAICAASGVPLPAPDASRRTADMVAMVDGFASGGARHLKARVARRRCERWLRTLVEQARREAAPHAPGDETALQEVSSFRDADGAPLDARTAAVELLNVLRPTVAVAWFIAFTAHALALRATVRTRLAQGDDAYAEAFANELRRFYPMAPFVGARATRAFRWLGRDYPKGTLAILDIYGQHHDPRLWPDPDAFEPERFLARAIGPFELLAQGGGDVAAGHRCPGERLTIDLIKALGLRLARLDAQLHEHDLSIPLNVIPTRPAGGVVLSPTH